MTDLLARFGYLARGVLYVTIGLLAGRAALASRSARLGPAEALRTLLHEPHGRALILLLTAGFVSFAIFSFAEMSTKRSRGAIRRASHGAAGIGSVALAIVCLRLLRVAIPGRPVAIARSPISWLLAQPWGRAALAAAGIVIFLAGSIELYRGLAGRFRDRFLQRRMGRFERRWAVRVTRFGLAAHAVLLLTIGFLGVRAAINADSQSPLSTRGAISWLSHRPFGAFSLAVLSAGLVSYGLSLFVLTLYRKRT
jgi:hypothetical protein